MSVPVVSVIIVTRNRVDELLRCLRSVETIETPAIEAMVVDNGSSDGTVERVREAHPAVRVLAAPENRGTSDARNAAARLSRGRFLWFLDDDAVVADPGSAARLTCAFRDDPRLGGVGGEAVLDDRGTIVGAKYLRLLANGLTEGTVFRGPGDKVDVRCLASCNLFLPRRVFEEAGGFDRLFFFYLEDLDLTWRIVNRGYRLEVWADTPVKHYFSNRARRTARFAPRRNRLFFCIKNMAVRRIVALPLLDLAYVANPARVRKLLDRARVPGRGPRAAVTAPRDAAVTARGLWEAATQAAWLVASLPASYLLVVPHLRRVLASRRRGGGTLRDTNPAAWRLLEPRLLRALPCSTSGPDAVPGDGGGTRDDGGVETVRPRAGP